MHGPLFMILLMTLNMQSCTEHASDPDPARSLRKVAEGYASGAAARIELYSDGDLFPGYNPVFISVRDSISGDRIKTAELTLYPEMNMSTKTHSCPVDNPPNLAPDGLFTGGIMFTMPSGQMGEWTLDISIQNAPSGLSGKARLPIAVKPKAPSRVIAFEAANGERYLLSYYFPERIKVGVNRFALVAFTQHSGAYIPAEDLQIKLDPEMPSMDHGSPNNENPVHTSGGHYTGKVNFTMTGEWRLNLEVSHETTSLGNRYFDVMVQ